MNEKKTLKEKIEAWYEEHQEGVMVIAGVAMIAIPAWFLGRHSGKKAMKARCIKEKSEIAKQAIIDCAKAYEQGFAEGVSSVVIKAIKEAK